MSHRIVVAINVGGVLSSITVTATALNLSVEDTAYMALNWWVTKQRGLTENETKVLLCEWIDGFGMATIDDRAGSDYINTVYSLWLSNLDFLASILGGVLVQAVPLTTLQGTQLETVSLTGTDLVITLLPIGDH